MKLNELMFKVQGPLLQKVGLKKGGEFLDSWADDIQKYVKIVFIPNKHFTEMHVFYHRLG